MPLSYEDQYKNDSSLTRDEFGTYRRADGSAIAESEENAMARQEAINAEAAATLARRNALRAEAGAPLIDSAMAGSQPGQEAFGLGAIPGGQPVANSPFARATPQTYAGPATPAGLGNFTLGGTGIVNRAMQVPALFKPPADASEAIRSKLTEIASDKQAVLQFLVNSEFSAEQIAQATGKSVAEIVQAQQQAKALIGS